MLRQYVGNYTFVREILCITYGCRHHRLIHIATLHKLARCSAICHAVAIKCDFVIVFDYGGRRRRPVRRSRGSDVCNFSSIVMFLNMKTNSSLIGLVMFSQCRLYREVYKKKKV
jgi:hypothetical protein